MTAPITWRNVDGPNPGLASQPLQAAGNSFNSAFDIFNKIISQRQALGDSNFEAADANAQQAYLTKVQSLTTPEAVAAYEASGEAARDRGAMSAAKQAQVRPALEARISSTRQNITAGQQYGEQQANLAEKPVLDAFNRVLLNKNWEGAEASIPNIMVRDRAKLQAQLVAAKEADRLAVRGRDAEGRADKIAALQLTTLQDNAAEATRLRLEGERQRGLDRTANAEISGYQEGALIRQREAEPLFKAFDAKGLKDSEGNPIKVPRNQDGSVNYAAIGKGLRGTLENHLADNNSYTLDELSGSDTAARRGVVAALRKAGANPMDLARLDPIVAAGLTTTPQALMGNDLAKAERDQRLEDASIQEASKQFVPLSDASGASAVANTVFDAINTRFGADTWKAEEWRQRADKFLREGIVAKDDKGKPIKGADGQPIKVIPSADTMLRLMGTVNTGAVPGFLWGSRWNANDLKTTFDEYLKDEAVYRGAGNAVQAGLLRSMRGISPLPPAPPPIKPK